jgi:release factor glutamine methyltransferase
LTLAEAIQKAEQVLSAHGVPNARLDAEVLLRDALGRDRAWLLAHIQDGIDDEQRRTFERTIERRAQREPLQYITGKQEFWGLEFTVTPDVLIPRPETELIVETVLGSLPDRGRPLTIVDLCTGSGCIAVSLARELKSARIFATDTSAKALDVARENAHRHGVAGRIRFLEGDLFAPLEELDIAAQVDMIVSNPPYVPQGFGSVLQPEVRDYEPAMALFAGRDGTEIHQRIIGQAPSFLKRGGLLIMEMGIGQAGALGRMVRDSGVYDSLRVLKDLAGIERVMAVQKK